MKHIIWASQAGFFYLFTFFIAAFPRSQTNRIGTNIGTFLHNILHSRRSIAVDNIRQALPYMQRHPSWTGEFKTAEGIALATFINLGKSIVEISRLYHGKGDILIDSIDVTGRPNLVEAQEKHKGIIFVGGHCGNWELMSLSLKRLFKVNLSAIARQQNNPYLNSLIEKIRMTYGNSVIYKAAALRPILNVLKNDGAVGMLVDQAMSKDDGILIEFLGRKAWANKGPAVIAKKTGVPIIPVFIHRVEDRHVLTISPEYVPVTDRAEAGIHQDIQALSRYLEDFICAHPADWYWVHRRWKRAGEPI